MKTDYLRTIERIQALAQTGLAYAKDPYDLERYQSLRALAARCLADLANVTPEEVSTLLSQESGYATPKVDVRGLVFRDDEVLLVRERSDACWTVPGGWADIGDTPSEAVVKEILEESGYQARVTKLLALYDRDRHEHPPMLFHVYKAFFLCEIVGGSPSVSLETDSVAFFPVDRLPTLSTTRVTATQIRRFHEHYRNPALATEFD